MLRKAGANWVEGDRFFDREVELEALTERVRDGTHTLLTAQRRMGKTSLVRELLRRLEQERSFQTVFVDLEDTGTSAEAVAEIAAQARPVQGAWGQLKSWLVNNLSEVGIGARLEGMPAHEIRFKLRAGIDSGTWRQRGDEVFAALAGNDRPVVLAIDELPILVKRLLKGADRRITPERWHAADEFLGWLRKNGQTHRGRVILIIAGSVSLEPILHEARLSAHANIYSPLDLKPWDEETAAHCLADLAQTYSLDLPLDVRREVCRRLRCLIPHDVQQFFDNLHEHLRSSGRRTATMEDVERVYAKEMLGVRGQMHYEGRLRMVPAGRAP